MKTALLACFPLALVACSSGPAGGPSVTGDDAAGSPPAPELFSLDTESSFTDTDEVGFAANGNEVYRERFPFEGRRGAVVRCEMTSDDVDCFLRLLHVGEEGRTVVGEDDDGGEGLDSRLGARLPRTGRYELVATTALDKQEGAFRVRVETLPPVEIGPAGEDARFALLVGAADYVGTENDLDGPRHDVENVRALLVDELGFDPSNVLVLSDARATRDHVIQAFREHLGRVPEGGVALFYYSGHGMRLEDDQAYLDEDDGRDDAFFLCDNTLLLDDELALLLDELRCRRKLVLLDNCHSGTATRAPGMVPREVRYRDVEGDLWPVRGIVAKGARRPEPRHVLLASSSEEEVSFEVLPNSLQPPNERNSGVFTHYLLQELRGDLSRTPEDVHRAIHGRVGRWARAAGTVQTPQLFVHGWEGTLRDLLFPSGG